MSSPIIPSVQSAFQAMELGRVSARYQPIDSSGPLETATSILDRRGIGYQLSSLHRRSGSKGTKHALKLVLDLPMSVRGDAAKPMLLLFNDHSGTSAFRIAIGLYRFVCGNGLILGDDLFSARIVHLQGPKASQFLNTVGSEIDRAISYMVDRMSADLELATSRELSQAGVLSLIDSLGLSERLTSRIKTAYYYPVRSEDRGNTVWHVWNIVNECMRKSSRSELRNTERNLGLLARLTSIAANIPA